jgi:hypothetical protein
VLSVQGFDFWVLIVFVIL